MENKRSIDYLLEPCKRGERKFSGSEAQVIKNSPKVYTAKPLQEATELRLVDKKDEQQANKGNIVDINPIVATQKSIKVAERVTSEPQ